jgi:hypothetical protein
MVRLENDEGGKQPDGNYQRRFQLSSARDIEAEVARRESFCAHEVD